MDPQPSFTPPEQNPVQPSNPTPVAEYKHPHFTPLQIWIAAVGAVIILSLGGAYIYASRLAQTNYDAVAQQAQDAQKKIDEIRQKRASSPSASSGQSAVPTDWKTYRNDQYGFEVKIPNDLSYKIDSPQSVVFYSETKANSENLQKCIDNLHDISQCQGLWTFSFYYQANLNWKPSSSEKINNNDFYVEEEDFVTIYRIYQGTNAYGFSIPHGMDDSGHLDLLNQILSTFKFTK